MSLYAILLFLHVSSAICLFIGFGIWLFGITAIARASRVEQVRTLADLMLMARLVVPASALLVIGAGLTMALTTWGLQTGWIAVALASLVLIGPRGERIMSSHEPAHQQLDHVASRDALVLPLMAPIFAALLVNGTPRRWYNQGA